MFKILVFAAAAAWSYDARAFLSVPRKSIGILRQEVTQWVEEKPAEKSGSYVSFSKNGEWLLSRRLDGQLQFRNLDGEFQIETFWGGLPEPQKARIQEKEIFFLSQGLRVEASKGWNWILRRGESLEGKSAGSVKSVWFSGQGRWALAEGLDGGIKLWRLNTLESEPLPESVILPESGALVLSAPSSFWERLKRFWTVPSPLRFATYAAQGRLILALKDGHLRFRDIASGATLAQAPHGEGGMLYSGIYDAPKGHLVVDSSGATALFSNH